MPNDRDTHFLRSAKSVWENLHTLYMADTENKEGLTYEQARERYAQMDTTLIAQRAYDLAVHVIGQSEMCSDRLAQTILSSPCFTDLTQWPESPTPRLESPPGLPDGITGPELSSE